MPLISIDHLLVLLLLQSHSSTQMTETRRSHHLQRQNPSEQYLRSLEHVLRTILKIYRAPITALHELKGRLLVKA